MTATPITSELRSALFAVWGEKCAYCGGKAEHVDHLQPKAKGGVDCVSNYVPACSRCNLTKSAIVIEEAYLGLLRARIRERQSKVLARLQQSPRKRVVKRSDTDTVTRVDMNVSPQAISWTARQKIEPWCPVNPNGGGVIHTGLVILEVYKNKEAFRSYSKTVPVWSTSGRVRGDVVEKGVSPGFPRLYAKAELILLARISAELGSASFEYDGVTVPRRADQCRPSSDSYRLELPVTARDFLSRYPHDIKIK